MRDIKYQRLLMSSKKKVIGEERLFDKSDFQTYDKDQLSHQNMVGTYLLANIGVTFPNRLGGGGGAEGEKCSRYHKIFAEIGFFFIFHPLSLVLP